MTENELVEVFTASCTAEPLAEGWPDLLKFGLAVAEAQREKDVETVNSFDAGNPKYIADAILNQGSKE